MEEVEFVLDGERDYLRIRGGTGPLVYPAGFVYLFVALRALTHRGTDIRRAQHLLAGVYLVTQAAVLRVYHFHALAFNRKYFRIQIHRRVSFGITKTI